MQNNDDQIKQNNEKTIKLIKDTKQELAKYRKQFEKDWITYEDAYYGKQHKSGEHYKTVKNHIFKIVEGETPILTDSFPGTTIIAESEDRQDDANALEKSIQYVYKDQNLQLLLPSLVRSFLISAPGWIYTYYDPDANDGDGQIKLKKLPWKSVFVDGNNSTIEEASKARIEINMRRDELIRLFPEHKDKIKGKKADSEVEDSVDNDNFEKRDISVDNQTSKGRPDEYHADDILCYAETWIKSYDLKPIEPEETQEELAKEAQQLSNGEAPDIEKWEDHKAHIEAHEQLRVGLLAQLGLPPEAKAEDAMAQADMLAQQNPEVDFTPTILGIKLAENHIEEHKEMLKLNPTGEEPKYDDGWRVIKSVSDIILYDGPNPEESGEIPLVPFYCYKDDTIYGFGEVKNILDPQRSLNEMDFKEYQNLKRNANSGWIADHESNVKPSQLTNDDGIVVIKAKGTEVRRLEPGTVSPQLANRQINDINSMEDISGVNEATQGRTPSPNASGAAINSLQNQAIGRIRLKDRNLQYYSMKRLGNIVSKLIINNWSTEKKLRFAGDGGIEELVFDPIRMQDLNYVVEIAPGSMAGIDKEALQAFYFNLLQSQQITFKEFLLVSDFPKKDILLKGLTEREKMQQEQDQVSAELAKLQNENIALKARIDQNLLTPEEQKVYQNNARQEAVQKLIGNFEANNGQSNNQGI